MFNRIIVLCTLSAFAFCNAQLPANFQKCSYGDSSCFTKMANSIISRGKTGYPELGLGVFDPLKVDKMLIHQKTGPVLLKIDLKNFKFGGLSNIKFSKVDGFRKNFERAKIEMKFKYPALNFNGPYKLEGKVLILPVAGSGMCNMTFEDSDVIFKVLGKKVEKQGKYYLKSDKSKVTFDTNGAKVHFEGLFGESQKALADTTNLFFNENWREIIKEIKPAVSEALAVLYSDIFDKVFGTIPYEDLFLP